jgi:hypothetical protein
MAKAPPEKQPPKPIAAVSDDPSFRTFDRIFTEALLISERDALSDGSLGFMARAMVQATLPHRQVDGVVYKRSNGDFTLAITNTYAGIPYGTIPRLLLSWITTEAVRTQSPELNLGDSLSGFMSELGMVPTGGRWGSITRLKDQVTRLATSQILLSKDTESRAQIKNIHLFDELDLWWQPKTPEQPVLWQSTLTLNKSFYDEVTTSPVPIDMRALRALKASPMALDLYVWMTYRMSYLKKPVDIPWESLRKQLGAGYADTRSGRQGFRLSVIQALKKVELIYYDANFQLSEIGLLIRPSKTHVGRRK